LVEVLSWTLANGLRAGVWNVLVGDSLWMTTESEFTNFMKRCNERYMRFFHG